MTGFNPRGITEEEVKKQSTSANPTCILEGQEPLVVAELDKVDEDLAAQLITVRHGNGIQIQADKITKYAGQWRFGERHGDGHVVSADGSEYRGNLHFG